ncbi:XRE family transcriptional regulator [Nocardiopsis sp. TSRI0078]|uniref:helix-turn-helix domain-containing protein n=1 Tax=unclassified Nocardiopsis TaxID=2649073 RepID=UPI0009393E06|nr:helix-turn-helix transcriptional regulator [Nocardiopsis sp. TSRI0078]OKI14469.1 XRE family transcriptional regulator [Nocardiopsis sp. TSRI0078]
MQDPRSPSLRLRRLATELRRTRESSGFTAAQVAKELRWSSTKVTRMESKEAKRIKPDDLDRLMDLYGITDPEKRGSMQALAKDARVRGWWSKYKDVFKNESLPDFEAEASLLRTYQSQVIPGLLQTPEYTEAIFRGGRYTDPREIERRVEARMGRREILTRFSPVHLRAVVDESAFNRLVGGTEVLVRQLEHLLHMAQMPHIDVQMLPLSAGAHSGLTAPFTILDFPNPLDASIVCVETLADALYLEEPHEVKLYSATFGDVQASAISAAETANYITEHIKTLESTS